MHQSAKSNPRRPARSNDLRAKTWPTVLGLQPPRYSIAKSGGISRCRIIGASGLNEPDWWFSTARFVRDNQKSPSESDSCGMVGNMLLERRVFF
jgi:hypothetical protein